ncbi:MAG: hypothetical protein JNL09_09990, partial [Anaerolineales bacterium]|nr:hypothetical protein [Anaerolineales bacterium]
RYVWDGRVQAEGYSPYQFPPKAPELVKLRQVGTEMYRNVWRFINRKEYITVYPPGAQLAYAGIWRVVGDSVTGFKWALVLAELLGAAMLWQLLRHFGQPPERLLIYLWSPLLIFEVAHAGHVDALMLPLLIAALWARVKERHVLLGVVLAGATLIKFFPALLLPALIPWPPRWSWRTWQPAIKMLAAFALTVALAYAPYLFWGAGVIGFLPLYFNENFNLGLARQIFELADALSWQRARLANVVTFGGLAIISAYFVWKPLPLESEGHAGKNVLVRGLWLIGWFTLTTQNLFPWYLLWLLPLIVILLEPGRFLGFKLASTTAWFIFTGTVMLAYVFFVQWRVVPWAQAAEFWPLYALLLLSVIGVLKRPFYDQARSPLPAGDGPGVRESRSSS